MKLYVDDEPKVCNGCIFKYVNWEIDKFSERSILVNRCRLIGEELVRIYEYKPESCPLIKLESN